MEADKKILEVAKFLNVQPFVMRDAINENPFECFVKTSDDARSEFYKDLRDNSFYSDGDIKTTFSKRQELMLLKWIELSKSKEELLEIYKIVIYCKELRNVVIRRIASFY